MRSCARCGGVCVERCSNSDIYDRLRGEVIYDFAGHKQRVIYRASCDFFGYEALVLPNPAGAQTADRGVLRLSRCTGISLSVLHLAPERLAVRLVLEARLAVLVRPLEGRLATQQSTPVT